MRIAVFTILAVHVLLLGALLLLGCRKTGQPAEGAATNENFYPTWVEPTNPTPVIPTHTEVTPSAPPSTGTIVDVGVQPPLPEPVLPRPAEPAAGTPPSVEPAPVAPAVAAGTTHVVVKGDSFFTLAQKHHVTMDEIAAANPGVNSSRMRIGQKLNIPPRSIPKTPAPSATTSKAEANVYVVKSGDNLYEIARQFKTTVAKLRTENKLPSTRIKVGQKLKIPPPTETKK